MEGIPYPFHVKFSDFCIFASDYFSGLVSGAAVRD